MLRLMAGVRALVLLGGSSVHLDADPGSPGRRYVAGGGGLPSPGSELGLLRAGRRDLERWVGECQRRRPLSAGASFTAAGHTGRGLSLSSANGSCKFAVPDSPSLHAPGSSITLDPGTSRSEIVRKSGTSKESFDLWLYGAGAGTATATFSAQTPQSYTVSCSDTGRIGSTVVVVTPDILFFTTPPLDLSVVFSLLGLAKRRASRVSPGPRPAR